MIRKLIVCRIEFISDVPYGPLHMAKQRQDDKLEPTYSSAATIWDVALKTCWKQWTIGRGDERGSEISVLMSWHDDDDDGSDFVGNCILKMSQN